MPTNKKKTLIRVGERERRSHPEETPKKGEVLCVLQAVRQDWTISLFSFGVVEFGFRQNSSLITSGGGGKRGG